MSKIETVHYDRAYVEKHINIGVSGWKNKQRNRDYMRSSVNGRRNTLNIQ